MTKSTILSFSSILRTNIFCLFALTINCYLVCAEIKCFVIAPRSEFFFVSTPDTSRISSFGDIILNGEVVGAYRVVRTMNNSVYCRLKNSPISILNNRNCYISYKLPTFPQKSETPLPKNIIPVPPPIKNNAESRIKIETQFQSFFGMEFIDHGSFLLTKSPLPYSRFNSLENLNDYLENLNKSYSSYNFSLPSAVFIKLQSTTFSRHLRDSFIISTTDEGSVCYIKLENGEIVSQLISPQTLKMMSSKFLVFFIAKRRGEQ